MATVEARNARRLLADPSIPYNILFGAGLSRDPPCNGPIWAEMPRALVSAALDAMEGEGWTCVERLREDRPVLAGMDVRPELFWRYMLDELGSPMVQRALQAAGRGVPNANHRNLAELLANGCCRFAVTTNFDEHLEALLPPHVAQLIADDNATDAGDAPALLKLHGSLSRPDSIAHTLEQYDRLADRNLRLLSEALGGAPLLILGYSGNDSDVLPALREIAAHLPLVVIVTHPGASEAEPIFSLRDEAGKVVVIEAPCSDILAELAGGDAHGVPAPERKAATGDDDYAQAIASLKPPSWPLLVMHSLALTGDPQRAQFYAWLVHDAACDERYRPLLDTSEFVEMHQRAAQVLHHSGDEIGRQVMLGEARGAIAEGGSTGAALQNMLIEAALRYPSANARGLGEPAPEPVLSRPSPIKPSQMMQGLLAVLRSWDGELAGHDGFARAWHLGMAKRREGDFAGAIEAFEAAASAVSMDDLSHLERGRFLLDFAGAFFSRACERRDDGPMEQALALFRASEAEAGNVGDWRTCAAAALMLVKINMLSGDGVVAARWLARAKEAAARTEDRALQERIAATEAAVHALGDEE